MSAVSIPGSDVSDLVTLISCPACGRSISTDAQACPGCGRVNDWVHPKLVSVLQYLRAHHPDAAYEVLGHRMAIEMKTYNMRQKFGSACLALSMLFLIGGFFIPTLMGLAILLLAVGGCLIAFGLSAFARHAIQIDIRLANPVVAVSDAGVWASVIGLVR
jgi:hypothetical protein